MSTARPYSDWFAQRLTDFVHRNAILRSFLLVCAVPFLSQSARAQSIPTGPPGYTFCSTENSACSFTGRRRVSFEIHTTMFFQTG